MNENLESLRYPIGKFVAPDKYTSSELEKWIADIAALPNKLSALAILDSQLNSKYRPGSWTIHQLIHHLADSHLNAYLRQKLAVTTDQPNINPYPEVLWAELEDVKRLPIQISINLMDALHLRWTVFLKNVNNADLDKAYYHPANDRLVSLKESIGLYAWHCNHHLAHIRLALKNPY